MQNAAKYLITIFFLFSTIACSQLEKRHKRTSVIKGSQNVESGVVVEKDYEEAPKQDNLLQSPKVGVILGPGGVKAIAQSGVLSELEKNRIPIDAIIGMEWGALVAAAYSQSPQANKLEWKLHKLDPKHIVNEEGLFNRLFEAKSIKPVINNVFSKQEQNQAVNDFDIDFSCSSFSYNVGKNRMLDRGQLGAVLSRCLPYPPAFEASNSWVASGFALKPAVEYLKSKGMDIIIFVNVLSDGVLVQKNQISRVPYASLVLWQELRIHLNQAVKDLMSLENFYYVDVNTSQYGIYQAKSKNSLIHAGKRSGARLAKELIEKFNF